MIYSFYEQRLYMVIILMSVVSPICAQSPEILLREFASGQIKKGVRSIGMGGNGATWGNYSLTWRDSTTALLNVGVTSYSNQNNFSFTGLGFNSPAVGRWVVYGIALSQNANNVNMSIKSPALGAALAPVHGDGNNQAVFIKIARPFKHGLSLGFLLSYERSQFALTSDQDQSNYVHFQTAWLPSGGMGLTWQPNNKLLFGFRGLFNHDQERRIDNLGIYSGLNLAHEYRLGFSVVVWSGALIDIGGNMRYRYNEIAGTRRSDFSPNFGFEQNLLNRKLALRCGVDESSATGGFSVRILPLILDVAYLNNLGSTRLGNLFGASSNSVITTLVYNYSYKRN